MTDFETVKILNCKKDGSPQIFKLPKEINFSVTVKKEPQRLLGLFKGHLFLIHPEHLFNSETNIWFIDLDKASQGKEAIEEILAKAQAGIDQL